MAFEQAASYNELLHRCQNLVGMPEVLWCVHRDRGDPAPSTRAFSSSSSASKDAGMMDMGAAATSILICLTALATAGYSSDLTTDKNALLSLKKAADLALVLDGNWTIGSNPCTDSWKGVLCDRPSINRVTSLKLEGLNLSGSIPTGTLGLLSELRVLSMKGNMLTGGIPEDIGNCTKLKKLFLNMNQLSGTIPDVFSGWPSLDRMDLSHNRLSGSIPASMAGLKQRLLTLRLEMNSLQGYLLDVTAFSKLNDFNVSWNNLTGGIPKGMAGWDISCFWGNLDLCGRPLPLLCPRHGFYVGSKPFVITVALVASFFLLVSVAYLLHKRKRKQSYLNDVLIEGPTKKTTDLVFVGEKHGNFELLDLLRAPAYILGKGTQGTTFKAVFDNGVVVAVKRLLDSSNCERKLFERRMQVVGKLVHPNLLPLRAYYFHSKQEKMLVHDYLPNGSLSSLLAYRGATLEWRTRLRIARGVAECLLFLHQQCKLMHGNVKPSNILVDENYHPQLSDFGLWPFTGKQEQQHKYSAPERKLNRMSDIYSYGMVLFELLTGKLPTGESNPSWAMVAMKDEWGSTGVTPLVKEQMLLICRLATLCTSSAPDRRPTAMQVIKMMQEVDSWNESASSPTILTGLLP